MVKSLIKTIAALNLALCFAPIISKDMIIKIMTIAGRLTIPPNEGAFDNDSGRPIPIAVSALLKYPDHPFATAAIDIPYSIIRIQPITHAKNSPNAT